MEIQVNYMLLLKQGKHFTLLSNGVRFLHDINNKNM